MIIRVEHARGYTVIDNTPIEDSKLSFRALGVLAYLLSRPDKWEANAEHLASVRSEGIVAVRAALKELTAAGYFTRERRKVSKGHFQWVSIIRERPEPANVQVSPLGGSPHMGDPHDGNPHDGKTRVVSTEVGSTDSGSTNPLAADAAGHLFAVPDAPIDPEQEAKDRAHALTVRVFERKTPKPAQKFVAVLSVAKALLAADWPEADVERAMVETPTISTRACEFTRSRWTNGHDPNAGIDTDRGGPTGLVDWRTS